MFKNISLSVFLIVSIFFSCKKEIKSDKKKLIQQDIKEDTLQKYVFKIDEKLNSKAKDFVKDWEEYQKLNSFLKENQVYVPNESILNAKELAKLTQELKDSIRIEAIDKPEFKIRLNVIHNEALRLKDMSEISVITQNEIKKEYTKLYEAFSALNSKLNNNISQEKLNKELEDFINKVSTSDSTYTNSVINNDSVASESIINETLNSKRN